MSMYVYLSIYLSTDFYIYASNPALLQPLPRKTGKSLAGCSATDSPSESRSSSPFMSIRFIRGIDSARATPMIGGKLLTEFLLTENITFS